MNKIEISEIDSRRSFISPGRTDRKSTAEILKRVRTGTGGDLGMSGATKEHTGIKKPPNYPLRRLGAFTTGLAVVVAGGQVANNIDNLPVVSEVSDAVTTFVVEPVADTYNAIKDSSDPNYRKVDSIEQFRLAMEVVDPTSPDQHQRQQAEATAGKILGHQP